MQQAHFHGQTCIIRKCTKGVDGGMDKDAGQQAAAAIKNRDQQEADCDCKDDLAQIADQLHTAAVEQVDDIKPITSFPFLQQKTQRTPILWVALRLSVWRLDR